MVQEVVPRRSYYIIDTLTYVVRTERSAIIKRSKILLFDMSALLLNDRKLSSFGFKFRAPVRARCLTYTVMFVVVCKSEAPRDIALLKSTTALYEITPDTNRI